MSSNLNKLLSIGVLVLVLLLIPEDVAQARTWGQFFYDNTIGAGLDVVGQGITALVWMITSAVGAIFLSIGGWFLDSSITYLVVRMGAIYHGELFGAVVETGWTIIRDLLNMCFIFALIYIGIKTILNSEDSGTRRALGYLIAAALLINFSLYITQVVVDFTNLLATQVYNQIVVSTNPGGSAIAHGFIDASGLTSWFNRDSLEAAKEENLGFGAKLFFYIMMMFFFMIAGFMFILGGIMIVTRFVALMLYMIFSPLMFIGWILPYFKKMSLDWWQGFFKQAFFGPIYILMLYFSLRILQAFVASLEQLPEATRSDYWVAAQNAQQMAFMSLFFAVMVGFLYASLKVGDRLSIVGGKMASNMMEGYAYRKTVGKASSMAVNTYDRFNRWTGGALTKVGGEQTRRAMVKSRDYAMPGSYGRADAETMQKEGRTRIRTQGRDIDLKKQIEAGNFEDVTDRDVVEQLKDPTKRQVILDNAGKLSPEAIKNAAKDKDIDSATIEKLKEQHKAQIKTRLSKSGEIAKVAEQFNNDAKEINKIAGKEVNSDEMAEYLLENSDMIEEFGRHVKDVEAAAGLKTKIHKAAAKKGPDVLKEITKKFTKSRSWN